jgi:hypothetical protein
MFRHVMFERDRKMRYAMSAYEMRSRDVMGQARRG